MKILLINDYATQSGAEIATFILQKKLKEHGHDARLFASSARIVTSKISADYLCFGTISVFQTLFRTANLSAFLKLRKVLTQFKPDVVHVCMFMTQLSPLILPLLRGIPSLCHVHTYDLICPLSTKMLPSGTACHKPAGAICLKSRCLSLRSWFPLILEMKLRRQWDDVFDLIVANSRSVKQRLDAENIGPVEVVYNGIPIVPARPPLQSPPTIAFAGRLVHEKGADILIKAFAVVVAEIPDAQLIIAGEGKEALPLKKLINELKLNRSVLMPNWLPHNELESLFRKAWIQVVPSVWEEPFGLVAIEAMMRGTAVIASATGGLSEIIENGKTGFLVPPGDVNALTEALLRLLKNCRLTEEMGRAGRQVALADFNEERYVEQFEKIYQKLHKKGLEKIGKQN